MRSSKGFTLIELLTVVAIIGILTVIVVPSYQSYVFRGKVSDATSNLAAKRVQMEQYYQDNRTYNLSTNPSTASGMPCGTDTTSSQYFTFSCPAAPDDRSYTIQAAGTGSMAGFSYTIDQNNTKNSSIAAPAPSGWIASSTGVNGCWIIKQGGGC